MSEQSGLQAEALYRGALADKVAIVSGGSQGLGREIVKALVAQGAHVVLADVSRVEGEATAASLGDSASFVETDVSEDQQIERCIRFTRERFGRLDILVNCAAIYADNGLDASRAEWHRTLDVNLVSAAIFAQRAAAVMQKGATIVNICSTGGKFGAAERALYPASKAALLQITKNIATLLAPRGIRCVSISPAWTWSPSLSGFSGGSIEVADKVGARLHPLGRVGRGDEVGAVVAFACSAAASWITGVDLAVDGGFSCLGPDQGRSPREWFAAEANGRDTTGVSAASAEPDRADDTPSRSQSPPG
ncbi:SDR family oxidoreductase [Paraburkholderia xenovorans]|jgi:NAD(P)-dependent dehydrogenase (short-subunit alcohol dehydrogenase family)